MVNKMNGKVLKVAQYNLQFGAKDRFVNVFSCFKYKPNGNIYVVYTDLDTKYNLIYYGSAHMKENMILSMQCRNINESDIIKEYIFKLTNKEDLANFEIFPLETIEQIELIGSDKIEVKPEIITSLMDVCFPKKEESIEPLKETIIKTKKKSKKGILLIGALALIIVIGFFYITTLPAKDTTFKRIICEKEYRHDTLKATVFELNTYNFNNQDSLEDIDAVTTFQFSKTDYEEFIMKGTYYKYLPDDDQSGGYKQDDKNYTFKIMMKEEIDTSYNKPTAYEEVFSYYRAEGYTCTEEIIE